MAPKKGRKPCLRCPLAEDDINQHKLSLEDLQICRHEVTNAEITQLWPDFNDGPGTQEFTADDTEVATDYLTNIINLVDNNTPRASIKTTKADLEAAAKIACPAKSKKEVKGKAKGGAAKKGAKQDVTSKMEELGVSDTADASLSTAPTSTPAQSTATTAPSYIQAATLVDSTSATLDAQAPYTPTPAANSVAPTVDNHDSAQQSTSALPSTTPLDQTTAGTPSPTAPHSSAPPIPTRLPPLHDPTGPHYPLPGDQESNKAAVARCVKDLAKQLAEEDHDKDQAIRSLPESKRTRLAGAKLDAQATRMIEKYGLRTDFAISPGKVEANFLPMKWPQRIYVYDVAIYRPVQNGQQMPVKKQWDMIKIFEQLLAPPHQTQSTQALRDNMSKWVTDGSMIWSIVPIFNETDFTPNTCSHDVLASPDQPFWYPNERGVGLEIHEIEISFRQAIDLTRDVSDLFFDNTSVRFSDSEPNILVKGLNAFFSRNVRRQLCHPRITELPVGQVTAQTLNDNPFVCNGSSKSYDATLQPGGQIISQLDGGDTVCAKKGFSLSIRPGVSSMYVNLSKATSPFFEKDLKVQDFLDRAGAAGRSFREMRGCLRGLKVRLNYQTRQTGANFPTNDSRVRFIKDVTNKSVKETRFDRNKWPGIEAMHDWYDRQSPFNNEPDFPQPPLEMELFKDFLVNVGQDATVNPLKTEWYPARALTIVPWQPFRGRITPQQTEQMISCAQIKPTPHKNGLISGLPDSGVTHFAFNTATSSHQGGLADARMSAGEQFITMPARWIINPSIQYLGQRKEPSEASWNLAQVKFAVRGTLKNLFILNISGLEYPPTGPSDTLFVQLIAHGIAPNNIRRLTKYGAANIVGQPRAWEDDLAKTMTDLVDAPIANSVVLVVLRDTNQDIYARVKRVADLRLGYPTVCVTHEKMVENGRGAQQLFSNIAMKVNLKLGGVNHIPVADCMDSLKERGKTAHTIVLGADVTHPGSGSHAATPSIAAVVGSVDDDFVRFPGSIRLQQSKKEVISDLTAMVKERLVAWALLHGRTLPKNVLFYRDGVSESQYDILRRRELPQVQIAMNLANRALKGISGPDPKQPAFPAKKTDGMTAGQLKEAEEMTAHKVEAYTGNFKFKMTFIVVGKRHNTRFYAKSGADMIKEPTNPGVYFNDNVKTGLVVDQVITHPYSMDFYLQSHQPLVGTGRSAHYFPLRNGMNLAPKRMQDITNAFCFVYARATRGVSYCAPAYYADRLCDRARAYFRYKLLGKADFGPMVIDANTREPLLDPITGETVDHRFDRNNETWATYRDNVQTFIEMEKFYFPVARSPNPWHSNFNNKMFYL